MFVKRSGRFDLGILDLGSTGDCVRRMRCVRFQRRHATGTAPRGMDWSEALEKFSELSGPKEGFYLSLQPRNNKYTAVLPNTGLQVRSESLAELERKYKRVSSDDAETAWRSHHSAASRVCSHAYWRGACRNGADCEVGLRVRSWHVLAGSLLAVWARVESVLAQRSMLNKMQVIRLKTDTGLKIVEPLKEALSYDAVSTNEQTFETDGLK
ncbi:Protein strawberry notch [Operophtera brumata]|uniref:Protein strawberry notch n=1 Tax=Operophtera brumata TaxID=104452 RepID=A0A0L7LSN6_OPEBR|nr:Protein strawberry notch [Operophtera brumata]